MVVVSRRWLTDTLIVGSGYAIDLLISWSATRSSGVPIWVVPVYGAAGYLVLLARRRYPIPVLAVVVAHSTIAALVFPAYIPTMSVWLAIFTVAACCELRPALLCLTAVAVPTWLNIADAVERQPDGHKLEALIGIGVMLVLLDSAVFCIGRWTRWSRRQRRIDAERAATDAAAAERSRIARDLHDVVAHSVTMMLVQAGGAARIVQSDPGRAVTALEHVDALGQQAIVELRRMLELMRLDRDEAGDRPTSLPGLGTLDELLTRAGNDVLRIRLTRTGTPHDLEPGVDLCAYRITQEALTNATRYAERGSTVRVTVAWHPDRLELSVVNRCPAVRPASVLSTGHGLLGMHERARAAGGHLTARIEANGCFAVRATLPVPAVNHEGQQIHV